MNENCKVIMPIDYVCPIIDAGNASSSQTEYPQREPKSFHQQAEQALSSSAPAETCHPCGTPESSLGPGHATDSGVSSHIVEGQPQDPATVPTPFAEGLLLGPDSTDNFLRK